MNQKLFHVAFRVSLKREHPAFFNYGDGRIQLWLFGNSGQDAENRASQITTPLNYQITSLELCEQVSDGTIKIANEIFQMNRLESTNPIRTSDMSESNIWEASNFGFSFRIELLGLEFEVPKVK